ncbi:MAG TPA: PAC2 family protein [Egibacteraceae bacterium]|nr:PAC2 family protein [Egibacteraceae bacterium]
MAGLLHWVTEVPTLRHPLLLVALEGFVDAGGVGSSAATFLRHRWQSEVVATFDRDALIDFRARRPTAVIDAGKLRRVDWPAIELLVAHVSGPQDVLLLIGPEPDMAWSAFCEAVVDTCRSLEVEAVFHLGAYPATRPHTRPVRIVKATSGPGDHLVPQVGGATGYTGPVGVATVLQAVLGDHGIPAVGLWAEVPHYIAGSPNPSGALEMARLVGRLVGTALDTTELEAAAKLHVEQVDGAVAEHPEARQMVAALERHVDAGGMEQELPSGEDIAAEIERFLRSQSD